MRALGHLLLLLIVVIGFACLISQTVVATQERKASRQMLLYSNASDVSE